MPLDLTTGFLSRLRARDESAWFELWENFGPVIRAQLLRWGRGRVGFETARDLSQETLASLSDAISSFDPNRGVRFSTWLLAIAKHALHDELDRRNTLKRGGGSKPTSLDEAWMVSATGPRPDAAYEQAVFCAKVCAAYRAAEAQGDFLDFSVYRMRVLESRRGADVAGDLGTSEATVSRRASQARTLIRKTIERVINVYSFTPAERTEAARNGLPTDSKKAGDAAFDTALGDVMRQHLAQEALGAVR